MAPSGAPTGTSVHCLDELPVGITRLGRCWEQAVGSVLETFDYDRSLPSPSDVHREAHGLVDPSLQPTRAGTKGLATVSASRLDALGRGVGTGLDVSLGVAEPIQPSEKRSVSFYKHIEGAASSQQSPDDAGVDAVRTAQHEWQRRQITAHRGDLDWLEAQATRLGGM